MRERRNQFTHPAYAKPECWPWPPNQVWSWDTTKLKGPAKWSYFYLYVILDIFSRYTVGWTVAPRESATLATRRRRRRASPAMPAPSSVSVAGSGMTAPSSWYAKSHSWGSDQVAPWPVVNQD